MTDTRGTTLVAAVDNDRMALLAFKGILPQLMPGAHWLWGAETADDAIRKALTPDTRPNVLLVDMSLGSATGVSVCHRIRQRDARIALLAITAFSVDTYAWRVAEAGAQGIVSKADMPQLMQALRTVAAGGTFIPAELAARSFDGQTATLSGAAPNSQPPVFRTPEEAHRLLVSDEDRQSDQPKLGAKEAETMQLLSQGLSYDQIAEQWGVASSTVRTHAHRAVDKLGARSLAHAVAIWLTH